MNAKMSLKVENTIFREFKNQIDFSSSISIVLTKFSHFSILWFLDWLALRFVFTHWNSDACQQNGWNCVANANHSDLTLFDKFSDMSPSSKSISSQSESILAKIWSLKFIWCLNLNFDLGDSLQDTFETDISDQQTNIRENKQSE